MKRRKFLPLLAAALVGAAMLAPSQARATFELRFSLNGGAFQVIQSQAGPGQIMGAVDGIQISSTATSSLGVTISKLDLAVSGILNQDITSLVVETSITGVPTTPPPQTLTWKMTSSSDAGVLESGQGWVDQSNQLYGGATGGPGGVNIVATSGLLSSFPAQGSKTFTATPPYSWTVQYSLGATSIGTTISTDHSESISTPAPAALILALTGMPVLGAGAWFRRRRTPAVA